MPLTLGQKAQYLTLLLLVTLITISSHPVVVNISRSAGIESGTILSRYIIIVFAGLFLMCFNLKSMLKPKIVKLCLLLYVVLAFFYLITYAFFDSNAMMTDVRSIGICLGAIMIGWQLCLDSKGFKFLLILYAGLTLFVGLMQIMTNIGGFLILDQYQTDNKNSLGVMLASGGLSFLVLGINSRSGRFARLTMFLLAIFSLIVLLTIRARAATLAFVLMISYFFYERHKGKNLIIYLLLGVFLLLLVYLALPQSIKEFVYNSFFQNYEGGDITSGRTERNIKALEVLSQNIWLGNITAGAIVGQIHNYLLNRAFEFGLILVLPIMILYLYLLFYDIKKTFKTNNRNNYNLGYYLFLIPFIISMAEPTFPYGPGTATVFNFLLFGIALRNTNNENQIFNNIKQLP